MPQSAPLLPLDHAILADFTAAQRTRFRIANKCYVGLVGKSSRLLDGEWNVGDSFSRRFTMLLAVRKFFRPLRGLDHGLDQGYP